MLNSVFDQLVKKSPISVMARGMMERVLDPQQLDNWFETTADQQYTKELLFATVFDVISQVVRGNHPSVHAAYQAKKEDIGVSITSAKFSQGWHMNLYLSVHGFARLSFLPEC